MVALRLRRVPLAAALAAALVAAAPAEAKQKPAPQHRVCADSKVGGGEWPSYGHDFANTRSQPREKVISPGDALQLGPVWTFSTTEDGGGEGDITGTPAVAGGCVYAATTEGWVFALNADSGKLAWKRRLPYGGGVNGSVTVRKKRVYVGVSRLTKPTEGCREDDPCIGPYVVALDRRSGRVEWATRSIDDQPGSDLYGSPVVFERTVMVGVSGGSAELGDEADRYAFQGSMVFIDTRRGRTVRKTWTIHPPKQPDDEFAGAGIWTTPAVDTDAKVAFAGTANPFKPQAEHEHANAVLKFDVDRKSEAFGEIIGSYKGNVDEYFPGLSTLPCYDVPGNAPPYYPQGIGACGDIDLDFGAAPNLITGEDGRKLVGNGQKSGVYHVFDAETMEPVASEIVGPPTSVGGIVGSTAYDGESVYGPMTVPGYLWSIGAAGGYRWAAPIADGVHWGNPVAVANGVVYTSDLGGFLDAFDARTGLLLGKHQLVAGEPTPSWGGVSIARHTIYATTGIRGSAEGHVVAFRPGGRSQATDEPGDGGGGGGKPPEPEPAPPEEPPEEGSGATEPPIIAGPGAASTSYATPIATTAVGGTLEFVNLDLAKHDVQSTEKAPDGTPLFSTPLIDFGETAPIAGLDRVSAGKAYEFFCSIHPGMRGTLNVR
ncbi:MAG TPA: PQQ-binding-like beta-propeller repeat protein [Solirubrobacterales bacterium]